MKSVIYLIILLSAHSSFSQTVHPAKFEYAESGINDYIVTDVNGYDASELYSKVIDWVKETYKNPDQALIMKIENKKIRINGTESLITVKRKFTYDLDYVYEISFKDDRYKFDLISLFSQRGQSFKKIQNFKSNRRYKKYFGDTPLNIERFFNDLNTSIQDYVMIDSENEDW